MREPRRSLTAKCLSVASATSESRGRSDDKLVMGLAVMCGLGEGRLARCSSTKTDCLTSSGRLDGSLALALLLTRFVRGTSATA